MFAKSQRILIHHKSVAYIQEEARKAFLTKGAGQNVYIIVWDDPWDDGVDFIIRAEGNRPDRYAKRYQIRDTRMNTILLVIKKINETYFDSPKFF